MQKVFIFGLLFCIVSLSFAIQENTQLLSEEDYMEYLKRTYWIRASHTTFGDFLGNNRTQADNTAAERFTIALPEQPQINYADIDNQQNNLPTAKPTL